MDNPYLDQVIKKIMQLDAQRAEEISDIILIVHLDRIYRMERYFPYSNNNRALWKIDHYILQIIRTTDLPIDEAIIISSRGITKFKFTDGKETNTMP